MSRRRARVAPALTALVVAGSTLIGGTPPANAFAAPDWASDRQVGRHAAAVISPLDDNHQPAGSIHLDDITVLVAEERRGSAGAPALLVQDVSRTLALDCGARPEDVQLVAVDGQPMLVLLTVVARACHLDGVELRPADPVAALLVVDLRTATLVGEPLPLPGATGVTALHPDGRHLYVVDESVEPSRVHLRVIDLADPAQPARTFTARLGTGVETTSLAIDHEGQRAFAASGTHTLVLDISDPERPTLMGRIADYMVRNHRSVAVAQVDDPRVGLRQYLTIQSALGDGGMCPSGTLHVYDITGDLLQRPLMAAESDLPRGSDLARCVTPTVTIDPVVRRMRVEWRGPDDLVRRDWFPYDLRPSSLTQAQYCLLLPA